jgi:hypothetical protein
MKENDLLAGYPEPRLPREVGPGSRTILNRIIASYKGKEFYDGDRNNGYGGYINDGRWIGVAKNMIERYGLSNSSSILQIGCDKGFLLEAFKEIIPKARLLGIETSEYAINSSSEKIKRHLKKGSFTKFPVASASFDLVIAIGPVYSLNLMDAIKCLKEIKRVSKGSAFITLGAYDNEEDFMLFRYWTLLGSTILSKPDWIEVLKHSEYSGDYKFNTAKSLNLVPLKNSKY